MTPVLVAESSSCNAASGSFGEMLHASDAPYLAGRVTSAVPRYWLAVGTWGTVLRGAQCRWHEEARSPGPKGVGEQKG